MQRWLIDMAGVQLTVCANDVASVALIELALSAMPVQSVAASQGTELSLAHDATQQAWELVDHSNGATQRLLKTGDVIYHLTDRIVFHIADNSRAAHCLHAAAVAHQGRAIIIPANSGAGKSSFTTWLAAKQFAYVTDELILIDDDQHLQGIARPIQIKSHGLSAVEHLIEHLDLVQHGDFANAVPVQSLGSVTVAGAGLEVGLLVFPKYRSDADFSFAKLSSAEAGMRLMANHVNARNLDGHGFRAMMALIRNTPCYSLEYGGFDCLPETFAQQLKALVLD
ncbi:hypothetical protein [Arenicella xantha]|uniref:Hpr(Ser) kinase/phosphatase n=1 Tax=Arenicella xantha TaxID=644221 RepID=A0A395JPR9_9GAMM|nr:hypothetical protein [Arenicella xantha]RBP53497.1 hypothetical protein DFR28_101883 [Arenicella xantha]